MSSIITQSVDVHKLSHAGGRKYEKVCGATLDTDTTTLHSNVNTIICFISSKA